MCGSPRPWMNALIPFLCATLAIACKEKTPPSPGAPASASAAESGAAPVHGDPVRAFTTYVLRHAHAPGEGGEDGKRPKCDPSGCEHGRVESGVLLRIRWRAGSPQTLRIFTPQPIHPAATFACAALGTGATEIQRWQTASTLRIQCAWPLGEGVLWVLAQQGPAGTTLAAFAPEHLAWDSEYLTRAFEGAPKPPSIPEPPPAVVPARSAHPEGH